MKFWRNNTWRNNTWRVKLGCTPAGMATGRRHPAETIHRRAAATGAAIALGLCVAGSAAFAQVAPPAGPPTDAEILGLVKKHCVQCHAVEPTHEAFAKPPAGIVLETIDEISQYAPRIMTQVVVNRAMPLGNLTGMTDEERNRLAAWIEGRK
jgi:uncharacterized membrane protein